MKKNKWVVEIRDSCKVCGGKLPNSRFRTYCSTKCRTRRNNKKQVDSGYSMLYQRKRHDEAASVPGPDKVQCLLCGKWYVQLGTHVFQRYGMTGREYRELFDLEVKRGIVPEWYRKLKGNIALDNNTYKNLEKGANFRFKHGQKGVGVYKRSETTIEWLRNLHKTRGKRG
jgi:hypothetical protein